MKLFAVFSVIAVVAMTECAFAAIDVDKVVKQDGGPSGYASVYIVDNQPLIGEKERTLFCLNPGSTECSYTVVHRTAPPLIGYAENQINGGNYHGTYSAVIGGIACVVEWHASDPYNVTIEERDEHPLE